MSTSSYEQTDLETDITECTAASVDTRWNRTNRERKAVIMSVDRILSAHIRRMRRQMMWPCMVVLIVIYIAVISFPVPNKHKSKLKQVNNKECVIQTGFLYFFFYLFLFSLSSLPSFFLCFFFPSFFLFLPHFLPFFLSVFLSFLLAFFLPFFLSFVLFFFLSCIFCFVLIT